MAQHDLKTEPQHFADVRSGAKRMELRSEADRHFAVGDTLVLREWVPPGEPEPGTAFVSGVKDRYTGESCTVAITHILRDPEGRWLQPDVAALSIVRIEEA
jgi:hypothetical protein